MQHKFQIFGSASSQDIDLIYFVDELPSREECKQLCRSQDELHNYHNAYYNLDTRLHNSNLGVVKDGVLVDVYKGTVDEVNNSLIDTYHLHGELQEHEQHITKRLERDAHLKYLRFLRIVLSFFSRSEHRPEVKKALKGGWMDKVMCLSYVTEYLDDIPLKNGVTRPDLYKTLAFQVGQVLGLMEGVELYTKEDISEKFDYLTPYLNREEVNDPSKTLKYAILACLMGISGRFKQCGFSEDLNENNYEDR